MLKVEGKGHHVAEKKGKFIAEIDNCDGSEGVKASQIYRLFTAEAWIAAPFD